MQSLTPMVQAVAVIQLDKKNKRRCKIGDRYILNLLCAHCGKLNQEVWYAPSCNSRTFHCQKCEKENYVSTSFHAIKITPKIRKQIKEEMV